MIQDRRIIQTMRASSCAPQETSGPMIRQEKAMTACAFSAGDFDEKEVVHRLRSSQRLIPFADGQLETLLHFPLPFGHKLAPNK